MEDNLLDEEDKSSVGYHFSEILKRYGLEEKEEEAFEKLEKDEALNGEILSELCSNLAKNLISETDAVANVQKKLNINEETAKKLINDIKTTILPLLKEIFKKRYNSEEKIEKKIPEEVKPITAKNPATPIKKPKIQKEISKLPKKIIQTERPKSSGSDSYREPIG